MAAKNDHTERSRQENDNQWRTLLNTPGLSKTDMVNAYSDWAKNGNFDMDMLADGYQAPDLTVKYFSESFPKEKRDEIKILDIGAGTGLVARGLREEGFCHIDALDASEAMMSVARKDGLYDKYFCEILSDKPLNCFEPNTYDGLTASACFSSNHIPADAFRELTRIVKPGGIVVIVSRLASPVFDDNIPTLMETLEQEGKMKRMLTETIEGFFQDEEMLASGYEAPLLTVHYFSETFPRESRNEVKVLDVGAGTGMVARDLRAEGFRHIDALDASEAMLSVARRDNLYDNYYCEFLSDEQLSCFEPDSYDGLTASGCFARNQIPPEALHEIIRIVKPGGIVVIVARAASPYEDQILPLMKKMEEDGKWKKIMAVTDGRFFLEDKASVWKYQVLKRSKQ